MRCARGGQISGLLDSCASCLASGGETNFFCGPNGLMLLAPLPGGRWLTFQDLEETVQTVSADDVIARTEARVGGRSRPTDVAWASPFRMHRRIVWRTASGS